MSRAGRVARRASWRGLAGPMARSFSDHKFRDRKYLVAASETAIIHSLTGQLLERDQSLPPNGRHIHSPPQPWPPGPAGGTASGGSNRLRFISAGQKTGDTGAPGRGRTDTGDPFRGPASSFGLRGLDKDTSAAPDNSRPAYGVEKDPLRCIYSILRSETDTKSYDFTPILPKSYTESSCAWFELHRTPPGRGPPGRQARPASTAARRKTSSSIAGVTRPVNVFCWLGW